MQVIEKDVEALIPYQNNPRNNEKAVGPVAESIKKFGFLQPIVIDKDNVVVCGHTRLKAAKKLKLKTVPCVCAEDLTEEEINAYRLADNKTNELAEWNMELLGIELSDIATIDMTAFGFELPKEIEEVEEDEFEEPDELPYEAVAKPGDIFILGQHRLMCGDSTSLTDLEKLLGGGVC